MNLIHARIWIVHKPTTIENEGCKANIDMGYHSKMEYQAIVGGIGSNGDT